MVNDFKNAHSLLKKQEACIEGKWKVLKEKLEENPTDVVMKKVKEFQFEGRGGGACVHLLSTWTRGDVKCPRLSTRGSRGEGVKIR